MKGKVLLKWTTMIITESILEKFFKKSKRINKTRKRTNLEVAELKIKALKVLQDLKRAEVEVHMLR